MPALYGLIRTITSACVSMYTLSFVSWLARIIYNAIHDRPLTTHQNIMLYIRDKYITSANVCEYQRWSSVEDNTSATLHVFISVLLVFILKVSTLSMSCLVTIYNNMYLFYLWLLRGKHIFYIVCQGILKFQNY